MRFEREFGRLIWAHITAFMRTSVFLPLVQV
jgi:hypothetical protein